MNSSGHSESGPTLTNQVVRPAAGKNIKAIRGELVMVGWSSLGILEAIDFAHASEGASYVRDGDGAADDERDIKGVKDFVALPAFFAAADEVVVMQSSQRKTDGESPLRAAQLCRLDRCHAGCALVFVAPLFSSTYKSLLVVRRFVTSCLFKHLQATFPATALYSDLYKTPGGRDQNYG
jgi:hypothetical protein